MRKCRRNILIILGLCFTLLLSTSAAASAAESFSATAVKKGVEYLRSVQNSDGGFASEEGRPSSKITTAWAIMALDAAGEDVNGSQWSKNGQKPLDYLAAGTNFLQATTDYARVLLAVRAASGSSVLQGQDLAAKIASFQQTNGRFAQMNQGEEDLINAHMWSVLALASAGMEIPQKEKARTWLVARQNADGGFPWYIGGESDPDDTGVAITALVLMGERPGSSATIAKALKYLRSQQGSDGGFKWTGQKKNTATDAWVIQGLLAVGADPTATDWQVQGNNPVTHLLGFQNSDGSFNWTNGLRSSPTLMTSYAVMALAKKPHPVNLDYARDAGNSLSIVLWPDSKEARVNGEGKLLEAAPTLVNNRTLVPLRFVGEYLGAAFRWLPEQSTVEITQNGKTFSLKVGEDTLDSATPAVINAGRTMVPLRYISEKLGASVTWNEQEGRIEIEK